MFVGEKNAPGPGQYNIFGANKVSLAFTMRPRTKLDHFGTAEKGPGPG